MPAVSSQHGVWTTTPYDHTAHCKISPRSSLPSSNGKPLHYLKNLSWRMVHKQGGRSEPLTHFAAARKKFLLFLFVFFVPRRNHDHDSDKRTHQK